MGQIIFLKPNNVSYQVRQRSSNTRKYFKKPQNTAKKLFFAENDADWTGKVIQVVVDKNRYKRLNQVKRKIEFFHFSHMILVAVLVVVNVLVFLSTFVLHFLLVKFQDEKLATYIERALFIFDTLPLFYLIHCWRVWHFKNKSDCFSLYQMAIPRNWFHQNVNFWGTPLSGDYKIENAVSQNRHKSENAPSQGNGIKSIIGRIEFLKGSVYIDSNKNGTTTVIEIPISV